ncbi:glycoside hydrolase family 25 protein [Streptomyces scabiei]|uniref:glycoside hydrolase family 25 protein n=1 Tax=Streptomyces scabiei TaxID=1930 RepID=UPI0027DF2C1C|nr:GH25 family lysozyme [Streptomyces sp. LBUM 1483]
MLHGIDVSSHQPSTPDVSGAQFVFVKATEGVSYVNPKQASQVAAARNAGCVLGFYHFARPGSVEAQAKYFVEKCLSKPGDILAIDWEDPGVSGADKDALIRAVKKLRPDHRVILYCNTSYWRQRDTTSYCGDGLWIADYSTPAGKPPIQHPWLFHQYDDSPVDQNVAGFDSVADLKEWAKGNDASDSSEPQWRTLLDHVMAIPEKVYETWETGEGWNNDTRFGRQYGENGVAWCVMFNWCMYDDVDLEAIVPKVNNVGVFTNWAKTRGQWSAYPSVGAWVNLGNGSHTEIVVGFDETYVYTKGGNSIKEGATDAGQGNGVWSHRSERRAARVVGYFAPKFPDGVCPPTADPNDWRGGKAQASYRWSGPAGPVDEKPEPVVPTVSLANIVAARRKDLPAKTGHTTHKKDVLIVEWALNREGLLAAKYVDGSWGSKTDAAYKAFRLRMGYRGKAATGDPGIESLTKLAKRRGFKAKKK